MQDISWLGRTTLLIGEEKVRALSSKHVLVVGNVHGARHRQERVKHAVQTLDCGFHQLQGSPNPAELRKRTIQRVKGGVIIDVDLTRQVEEFGKSVLQTSQKAVSLYVHGDVI